MSSQPVIALLDNFDSFTYNLVQLLGALGAKVNVVRSNRTIADLEACRPTHLVISPGPKAPKDAGISCAAIRHFAGRIPILGVCLGHQAIGVVFGAKVIRAPKVCHGKPSRIRYDGNELTAMGDGSWTFMAGRYHSLVVEEPLPDCLEAIAWTDEEPGLLMALQHRDFHVYGVQFHPESLLTASSVEDIYDPEVSPGAKILANFLSLKKAKRGQSNWDPYALRC